MAECDQDADESYERANSGDQAHTRLLGLGGRSGVDRRRLLRSLTRVRWLRWQFMKRSGHQDGQPAKRVPVELQIVRRGRGRELIRPPDQQSDAAPADHQDDHRGRYLHYPEGIARGLVNALDVAPPEVDRGDHGDRSREMIDRVLGRLPGIAGIGKSLGGKADYVLARGHAGNRAGKDIVKHQGRNAYFGEGAAESLFNYAVDAATSEHGAAFNVNRADRIAEQHYGEYEPGSSPAGSSLGDASGVVGGGCKVIEDDSGGAPEGYE